MSPRTSRPRVVSLIASATEIVAALGHLDNLVGRSHECDFPPEVARAPVLTEPRFSTEGSSAEIDRRVRASLADALSVYRVDRARLEALAPDVIVTQDQCEVCAVSLADVEAALADWLESRPLLVSLKPNALGDVWSDIARLAKALGSAEAGSALIRRLKQRMDAIARRARQARRRPSLACIEWIDPLMAAGNWMPELVAMAGGIAPFGEAGRHSPTLLWEDLVSADPDAILIMPCGFGIERSSRELACLVRRPEWSALAAVRNRRLAVADGNAFFNRPGPRLAESLEILAEILHPELFDFGHRGTGWIGWDSCGR
ncbi:MAG: cobalamin-binding protein [Proteobacteria bacterium]|nr:cobalamin-binding protein [Pseudomonadota bacterium]MBI3497057.1 cobalamin-binding protein [Pseudomonadota bacterium]